MRIGFLLLAACLLLSGCSTSTQVIRTGFTIAQQAPASLDEALVKKPAPQSAQVSSTTPPVQRPATQRILTQKKTRPHVAKSPAKRIASLLPATRRIVIPRSLKPRTYVQVYSTAKSTLEKKTTLDKTGCACIGLAVLATLVTIGIALLWKVIFGKPLNFYGMIVIGAILLLAFIFIYSDMN